MIISEEHKEVIMAILESVAYLRGLADGLDIGEETKEAKLLSAIIDVLDDIAQELEETSDTVEELNEYIEEIDEDLGELEEAVCDLYDEDCCCCDDDDCCCDEDFEDGEEMYRFDCPKCGETVYIDAEDIELNDDGVPASSCPFCGEPIEFDFEEEDEESAEEE